MDIEQLQKENDWLRLELELRTEQLHEAGRAYSATYEDLKECETRLKELQAHIERLREAGMRVCGEFDGPYSSILFGAISETPVQSLNHIKAQVEEETIEICKEYWDELDNVPRKYKEQSNED